MVHSRGKYSGIYFTDELSNLCILEQMLNDVLHKPLTFRPILQYNVLSYYTYKKQQQLLYYLLHTPQTLLRVCRKCKMFFLMAFIQHIHTAYIYKT